MHEKLKVSSQRRATSSANALQHMGAVTFIEANGLLYEYNDVSCENLCEQWRACSELLNSSLSILLCHVTLLSQIPTSLQERGSSKERYFSA